MAPRQEVLPLQCFRVETQPWCPSSHQEGSSLLAHPEKAGCNYRHCTVLFSHPNPLRGRGVLLYSYCASVWNGHLAFSIGTPDPTLRPSSMDVFSVDLLLPPLAPHCIPLDLLCLVQALAEALSACWASVVVTVAFIRLQIPSPASALRECSLEGLISRARLACLQRAEVFLPHSSWPHSSRGSAGAAAWVGLRLHSKHALLPLGCQNREKPWSFACFLTTLYERESQLYCINLEEGL